MSTLTTGNAKRFLPIFSPSYIGDYDQEGFENVPSEDFDPGFGCVPVVKPVELKPPPPVKQWMTPEQIECEKGYQEWLRNRFE